MDFDDESQSELRRNLTDDFDHLSNLDEDQGEGEEYRSFNDNVVNSIDPHKSLCEKSNPDLAEQEIQKEHIQIGISSKKNKKSKKKD